MQIVKEDLDRWFDCGIYPRTRTIWLGSIHTNDSVDEAEEESRASIGTRPED